MQGLSARVAQAQQRAISWLERNLKLLSEFGEPYALALVAHALTHCKAPSSEHAYRLLKRAERAEGTNTTLSLYIHFTFTLLSLHSLHPLYIHYTSTLLSLHPFYFLYIHFTLFAFTLLTLYLLFSFVIHFIILRLLISLHPLYSLYVHFTFFVFTLLTLYPLRPFVISCILLPSLTSLKGMQCIKRSN